MISWKGSAGWWRPFIRVAERWQPSLHIRGSKANPELFFQEAEVWGASAVLDPLSGQVPKEMTQNDITSCIEAFASAAARSPKAGFDAIQLHGAHGYGINQFLSGFFNRRSDKYGGAMQSDTFSWRKSWKR